MHSRPLDWVPDLSDRPGPKYLSITRAMVDDIATGALQPGMQLPTHRELAYQLGVTVGTVSRAYAEATRRGLIDGEVGRGTFIRRRIEQDMGAIPVGASRGGIDLGLNFPPMGNMERDAFSNALKEIAESRDLMNLMSYAPHGGARVTARRRQTGCVPSASRLMPVAALLPQARRTACLPPSPR